MAQCMDQEQLGIILASDVGNVLGHIIRIFRKRDAADDIGKHGHGRILHYLSEGVYAESPEVSLILILILSS